MARCTAFKRTLRYVLERQQCMGPLHYLPVVVPGTVVGHSCPSAAKVQAIAGSAWQWLDGIRSRGGCYYL